MAATPGTDHAIYWRHTEPPKDGPPICAFVRFPGQASEGWIARVRWSGTEWRTMVHDAPVVLRGDWHL